jgi:hypothetical protein
LAGFAVLTERTVLGGGTYRAVAEGNEFCLLSRAVPDL